MSWSKKTNFSEGKEYITTYDLASYLKVSSGSKYKKFQQILARLNEEEVSFLNENNELCLLVEKHHSQGRYDTFFRVQNRKDVLSLLARVLNERGLGVYPMRSGLYIKDVKEKLGEGYSLSKIKKLMESFYRLQRTFVNDNDELEDLVFLNSSRNEHLLNPSAKAFQIFKQQIEKRVNVPVLSPARVAVRLGLHKGFGTTIEKQLEKLYRVKPVYIDDEGNKKPLIHCYIISNKKRYYLSSDANAVQMFKEIQYNSRQKSELPPAIKKLKESDPCAFYVEIQEAYHEGVLFENDSGKMRPLIERRLSRTGEDCFIIAPDINADKLFAERLKKRILENERYKRALASSALAERLNLYKKDTYSLSEVLKMLYEKQISYMDSRGVVRPLVLKKNKKYVLDRDAKALRILQTHLKTFVDSYAEKPATYKDFHSLLQQSGLSIKKHDYYKVLDKIQKEGLSVLNADGYVSYAVQRYRVKNCVMPFLNNSAQAVEILKQRIRER